MATIASRPVARYRWTILALGTFAQATIQDVNDAVAAAKGFSLEWDRMGWRKRVELIRNAADLITDDAQRRRFLAEVPLNRSIHDGIGP